jgi:aspartyl-tRNA(Asn)/glutamyl-tRNA(Gln) amidotransferase subunit B
MSVNYDAYETVVGLEVHAQLLTRTKLFCGDSASFGGQPNTHVSPVTLGHPGTLPKLNKKAVAYAVKMGLACHSKIERHNYFARKNYFYPDLPKGYQISQHTTPICKGGHLGIRTSAGNKSISLNRIHLEEDAGKSLHDQDENATCVDLNRAGVPLIEIVTEPELKSSEDAHAFLTELRKILRYIGICDGNMEEGSMRCDANISIRHKGDLKLGTKVEVKNLNSIRNVKRAIEYEAIRMMELIDKGERILQQTRSFDAATGTTFALRSKEEANDYRYFPDPDLPPFRISDDFLEEVTQSLPALPKELIEKYTQVLQLPEYSARVLTDEKETSDYFEELIRHTNDYKSAANWMLGPVKSYLNENNLTADKWVLSPGKLAGLIQLVGENKLSFSIASSRVLPAMIKEPESDPLELAGKMNILQSSDSDELQRWVEQALALMPEKVKQYQQGKKGLIGLFMGEVKKLSGGKADPRIANRLLLEKLEG